ncbi:unnamed protein product [Adineta steineri]|uniref:Zinc-binding loop region of homing endonuclease domain-containing protein n=1 Tax=Adineta steineri TaxID=433720 RepID=A0A819DSE3_9BILA|nr:unnamed protein product [Adineta steineri]CAF3838277.1 unnamed protein product [Adineta steineri]
MPPIPLKRLSSSQKEQDLPRTQAFLNYLLPHKANVPVDEIIERSQFRRLINHHHLPIRTYCGSIKIVKKYYILRWEFFYKMVAITLCQVLGRDQEIGETLPFLFVYDGAHQGSHLCNTMGCISGEHLGIEKEDVNVSPRNCFGIVLQIHRNTAGADTVTNIKPCVHGKNKEKP